MSQKNTKTLDPAVSISVLHDVSQTFGGRVTKKKVMLMGGIVLTQQLRALYRDHRIELLANDDFMLADVGANYGPFELLKINPTITHRIGTFIRTKKVGKHVAFTIDRDLSPEQSKLFGSGVLHRLVRISSCKRTKK